MKKISLCLAALLCFVTVSRADEGMWMVSTIDQLLQKQMQKCGCELGAREIYSVDENCLCDAIVSMDFFCTGSMISDKGLLITNHHCAYAEVYALSTDEKNYLEDGFWAMNASEEIPIKGKSVQFLTKVIDVTEETEQLLKELCPDGKKLMMRRVSHLMESRYSTDGLDACFTSMWSGKKYYISLYKTYTDVRLVASPAVCAAAFGGDTDNWDWPQHKCDFALYRIYTAPDGSPAPYSPDNVPLVPERKLKISTEGYTPGSYSMVIGYPGSTNRYCSAAALEMEMENVFPYQNSIRAGKIDILREAMNADPAVRLRYSDMFFSLTNVQELYEGETECIKRDKVLDHKKKIDKELAKWIAKDTARVARYGALISDLDSSYRKIAFAQKQKTIFRESMLRYLGVGMMSVRVAQIARDLEKKSIDPASYIVPPSDSLASVKRMLSELEGLDPAVEKKLFEYSLGIFAGEFSMQFMGPYQREMICRFPDVSVLCDSLWDNSAFTSFEKASAFVSEGHTLAQYQNDPLVRFLGDIHYADLNKYEEACEGCHKHMILGRLHGQALYDMYLWQGKAQYPNANSTMRLTYGTVKPLPSKKLYWQDKPDTWQSYVDEILLKYKPSSYEFSLNGKQLAFIETASQPSIYADKKTGRIPANFLTTNDITGGNSGSPVLNAKGELIGLAFDGNKESLSSDREYVSKVNRCVCVDIRYILWTIDNYGCHYLIEEMGM